MHDDRTTALRDARARWGLALVALACATLGGCAHHAGVLASAAAEEMPKPLIQESLRALTLDETRDLVAEVLAMPEVHDATRALVSGITDGTVDALTDEARAERLATLADGFVARIAGTLATVLERDLAPTMVRTLSQSLDASLRQLLSEETAERLADAVATVARESAATLAIAVRDELGPAMRAALRNDIAPGVRDALADPEIQDVISHTTRTMSRSLVLGVQDAFEEIALRDGGSRQTDTILTRMQDVAGSGFDVLQIGMLAMALGLLVLLAFLLRAIARAREHEAESLRRESAILALTEAIKSTEGRPWSRELLDMLKQSFRDNEQAEYLRGLLRRNRHLRMSREPLEPGDPEPPETKDARPRGPGTFEPAT